MKHLLNILRLLAEVLAAVAAAEVAVVLLLPVVAPEVAGTLEAALRAGMLSILAGPVITWRLVAAKRRAGTALGMTKAPKPWRLIAGTAGVLAVALAGTGVAVYKVQVTIHAEAKARFEQLSERLVGEAQRRVTQPQYGLAGARGVYRASKSVERGEFEAYVASRDLPTEFPGAIGFGFIQRVMRTDLDAFIAAERAEVFVAFTPAGGMVPRDFKAFRYIGSVTRGETTLSFESDKGGMQAHYIALWVASRGTPGPWSDTASATVAA